MSCLAPCDTRFPQLLFISVLPPSWIRLRSIYLLFQRSAARVMLCALIEAVADVQLLG